MPGRLAVKVGGRFYLEAASIINSRNYAKETSNIYNMCEYKLC